MAGRHVCCVPWLSSQHPGGARWPCVVPTASLHLFVGSPPRLKPRARAGVRVKGPSPSAPIMPEGTGDSKAGLGRPSAQKETGPGAMGSVTLASRKALSLPLWDTPSPADSVEHSGCSGATSGQARPSPTPPKETGAAVTGPSPRAGSPEDSQAPSSSLGRAGVSQGSRGPREGLSPAGLVRGAASSWRRICWWLGQEAHLLQDGLQLAVTGLVTQRGHCPPWPTEAEAGLAARWWSCVWPTAGAVQCRAPQPAGGLQESLGPGPPGLCRGRLPRPPEAGLVVRAAPDGLWTPSPQKAPAGAGPVVPVGASGAT